MCKCGITATRLIPRHDHKQCSRLIGNFCLFTDNLITHCQSTVCCCQAMELPNGSTGQLLDIMDYISNSVMMPFIALLSTILIGWVMTPDYVIDEMERNGSRFRRKKLYRIMIRYVAPVMMFILFLQSTGVLS